jgi:hypothetical protein
MIVCKYSPSLSETYGERRHLKTVQWRIFEPDISKLAVEFKILCNEKLLDSCSSFYTHICMVLNLER